MPLPEWECSPLKASSREGPSALRSCLSGSAYHMFHIWLRGKVSVHIWRGPAAERSRCCLCTYPGQLPTWFCMSYSARCSLRGSALTCSAWHDASEPWVSEIYFPASARPYAIWRLPVNATPTSIPEPVSRRAMSCNAVSKKMGSFPYGLGAAWSSWWVIHAPDMRMAISHLTGTVAGGRNCTNYGLAVEPIVTLLLSSYSSSAVH